MEERSKPPGYRDSVNLTYISNIAQLERQLQAIELSYMADLGVLDPLDAVILTNGGAGNAVPLILGDPLQQEDEDPAYPPPAMTRLKSVTHGVYGLVKSDVGLILLLVCYVAMGAAVMSFIEEKTPQEMARLKLKEIRRLFADICDQLESLSGHDQPSTIPDGVEALNETTGNETWSLEWNIITWSPEGNIVTTSTEGNTVRSRRSPSDKGNLVDVGHFPDDLRDILIKCNDSLMRGDKSKEQMPWSFWGAVYFCVTILTTVGYGNIAPTTNRSRVATMVFAVLGIPLFLVVLSKVGKSLTRAIKFLWSFVRRFYYTGSCQRVRRFIPLSRFRRSLFQRVTDHVRQRTVRRLARSRRSAATVEERQILNDDIQVPYEVDDKFNLPPVVAIAIAFLYIHLGAFLYMLWESWTYLDSFYFTFISLCTIGLGDIVPDHPKFFLASSFYLLFGLALIAMVITVIMEAVTETIHKATDTVRQVKRRFIHIAPGQCLSAQPRASIDISINRRRSV